MDSLAAGSGLGTHLSKIEETQKDMDQHLLIHSLMLGVSSGGGRTPALNTANAEKIPRPQIRDEGTDSDWSFFLYRWSEYKENSGLAGQQVTDQLRHCASVKTQR